MYATYRVGKEEYCVSLSNAEGLVNGQQIRGGLFMPISNKQGGSEIPGVILFHGMTSSRKNYYELAKKFSQQGIACLAVSLRGHDDSDGDFNSLTVQDLINDGIVAYDYLSSIPIVDYNRIGICGSSLGAAIALAVAKEKQVKSLVLRAPAVYTQEMMTMTLNQIMEKEESIFADIDQPDKTIFAQAAATFTCDILIITSEYDKVIPQKIPQAIFLEAWQVRSRKLVTIPGAGHVLCDPDQKEQFYSLTESWMRKHLLEEK